MKISHAVIKQVVTQFLGNQPINTLIHQLFRNGKQVQDDFDLVKNTAYFTFKDGVGTLRIHWNDIVPQVLQNIEKTNEQDTQFTVSIKGLEAEIVVSYDQSSMWFNITSDIFDKFFALAAERSKE